MAEVSYNIGKLRVGQGLTVLDGAALRVVVFEVAPVGIKDPDLSTLTAILAVATTVEATGTGAARKSVTSTSGTQDDTNNRANFDAADITWTGANWGDFAALVMYDEGGGTDSTRYPLYYSDTNCGFATNGGDVTMNISDFFRIS